MGKLFPISMFMTSFVPLWLSIFIIYVFDMASGGTNVRLELLCAGIILLANLLCLFYIVRSFHWAREQQEPVRTMKWARREKAATAEFLLAYILPLFAFDFKTLQGWTLFLLFFAVLCFLCVRNGNIYANLFLELRGYRFYTCLTQSQDGATAEVLVLSRRNLAAEPGGDVCIVSLGEPVYVDVTSKR